MISKYTQSLVRIPRFGFRPPTFDASKDYYSILGINKSATQTQIKQSFYGLAKKFHPDMNKGKEDKFKEINEAYEVLSDDTKKREYDEVRSAASQQTQRQQYHSSQNYSSSQQQKYSNSQTRNWKSGSGYYGNQQQQQEYQDPNSYSQFYQRSYYNQNTNNRQQQDQMKAQMAADVMREFMEQLHRKHNQHQDRAQGFSGFQRADQMMREEFSRNQARIRAEMEQQRRIKEQQEYHDRINMEREMREREEKLHKLVDDVLKKTDQVLSEGKRLKDGLANLWSTFTKK